MESHSSRRASLTVWMLDLLEAGEVEADVHATSCWYESGSYAALTPLLPASAWGTGMGSQLKTVSALALKKGTI